MRINIYSEEITQDVALVKKENVIGADGQPTTFYGVRLCLASPDVLHRTSHDDDRSAITFWFQGHETEPIWRALGRMLDEVIGALELSEPSDVEPADG